MELQRLQEQINELDQLIQGGGSDAQLNLWEMQRQDLKDQLLTALTEEAQQQTLQERVDQAKETGYILDTIEINGLPAISFSHTPENHELLAIAVQKWGLAQEDAFNAKIKELEQTLEQTTEILRQEHAINDHHESTIIEQDLVIKDLDKKLKNATDIIAEKDTEIKRLQEQQVSPQAVPVAPLSAEEQDTKLIADLMGNRLKVTNIRFKDESGIDRRKVLANNALTGEEIEEYAIYSITRWEEVTLVEAAQLQADYAEKKAQIEEQNAVIPTLDSPIIEPVTEVVEPVTEIPFQETMEDTNSQGDSTDVRNESVEQVVAEESKVDNSPVSKNDFNRLVSYVNHLSERVQALDGAEAGLVMSEVA